MRLQRLFGHDGFAFGGMRMTACSGERLWRGLRGPSGPHADVDGRQVSVLVNNAGITRDTLVLRMKVPHARRRSCAAPSRSQQVHSKPRKAPRPRSGAPLLNPPPRPLVMSTAAGRRPWTKLFHPTLGRLRTGRRRSTKSIVCVVPGAGGWP